MLPASPLAETCDERLQFAEAMLSCKHKLSPKQRTQTMATTQARNGAPNVDAAYEQVKDFNEQWLAAARKAGNFYIDSYEKIVDRTLDIELRAASMTQQEWLKSLIEAQADLTRELTNSYTSAARALLK